MKQKKQNKVVNITIKRTTHTQLEELCPKKLTYDQIIQQLINEHNKK